MACTLPKPTQGTRVTANAAGKRVAHAQFQTRINHTDLLTVDVVFPTNSESGTPAARFPGVVFLQDEGVAPAAYEWLTDAIASWGYFVAIPHHVADKPRYNPGAAAVTVDLFVSPPNGILQGNVDTSQLTLIGHGEGARIGAKVLKDRAYTKLALLAGLPDAGDRARLRNFAGPWQAFVGTEDCKVTIGALQEALGAEHVTALEGVGHEQFFEGGKAGGGCGSPIADDSARMLITKALRPFVTGQPNPEDEEGRDAGGDLLGHEAGQEAGHEAGQDAGAEAGQDAGAGDAANADGGAS